MFHVKHIRESDPMLTVKFKVNAKVTGYGVVGAGQIRDFEDEDYANGLVADGLATIYEKAETPVVDAIEPDQVPDDETEEVDLDQLTVEQLKAVAKEHDIKGYSSMKREELIESILATLDAGE